MNETSEQDALSRIVGIPQDDNGPVFSEPWEAEAFAMTLSAYEHGLFTWSEWARFLSEAISDAQRNGDPDDGSTYYNHWLAALENIVVAKGVVNKTELKQVYDLWDKAAHSTPHGEPIIIQR